MDPQNSTEEIWKIIPGYGRYEISNFGRLRRLRTKRIRKTSADRGYYYASLWTGEAYKRQWVHRLVLLSFVGPPPSGCETLHLNGVRSDNRLANLQWGTHQENLATRITAKGEAHGKASLTATLVREIRALTKEGKRQAVVARILEVSPDAVQGVVSGRNWKHIK